MIKIYPEWNVNVEDREEEKKYLLIKIYPEWNVNIEHEKANPMYCIN